MTYWLVTIYKANGRKEVREQLDRDRAKRLADGLISEPWVESVAAREVRIGR